METKVNVLSDTEHEIEVKLEYNEIKEEIDAAYAKERKTISMPGFRKGKVPMSMLKKMYGEAIEYKASEDIANKKFWDVVKEQNLKPLSMPQMTDLNFEMNNSLSFKVKYEVKPTLNLKDYTGLEIEKPIFKVKDEDIAAEVNNMLKSKATFELADEVLDNNYKITVDLKRLDKDGKEMEGGKSENIAIDLSETKVNENIVKNAQNKKNGEEFEFSFTDRHMHGDHEHVEDYHYVAVVKKIEKIVLPEPTEELIEQLSSKKAKTLEELTNFTKSNYENYYNDQSQRIYENSLLSKIVENNDFEPSKHYVETILNRLVETEKQNAKQYKQPVPNDNVLKENLRGRAQWNAKFQIILENIAEKENISVTDEDLEKLANEEAEKVGIPVEKLIKYYKDSNRQESMIEEKVINFLKENNKAKEVDPEVKAKEAKEKKEKETKAKESAKKSEDKK
ncbi:MAG: trigger factor [Ignavibacteriales bacterium]|nr:trigger factor [Ignavibacteriales bacterium]MCB9209662.1 trigger factor [Ignavibacteriales bacterium]